MIDLSFIVMVVVSILVAGAVFALLFFLIDYVGRQFPGEPMPLFVKVAKIALVVLGILCLIFMLISLGTGVQPFVWHRAWW